MFDQEPYLNVTDGQLMFTVKEGMYGRSVWNVTLKDDGSTIYYHRDVALTRQIIVAVLPVNDAPRFEVFPLYVWEDTGNFTGQAAFNITTGSPFEPEQQLTFVIYRIGDEPCLLAGPQCDASMTSDGNVTFETGENRHGSMWWNVTLHDDGGTDNGGVNVSIAHALNLIILPVNDAPSFTMDPSVEVEEDSGQSVIRVAYNMSTGNEYELDQNVSFALVHRDGVSGLLADTPTMTTNGSLYLTVSPDQYGTVEYNVTLVDDGGTERHGVNESAAQVISVHVLPVNDAPTFEAVPRFEVWEDSGTTLAQVATNISTGNAFEYDQNVSFSATFAGGDNFTLFPFPVTFPPPMDSNGVLNFTVSPDQYGETVFDLVLTDDGGTLRGGHNTSVTKQVVVAVLPVNDVPKFDLLHSISDYADGGHTSHLVAFNITPGNDFELHQAVSFVIAVDSEDFHLQSREAPLLSTSLFAAPPAVTPQGELQLVLSPLVSGVAILNATLTDDGGTLRQGVNQSQVVQLQVRAVKRPVPVVGLRATQVALKELTFVWNHSDVQLGPPGIGNVTNFTLSVSSESTGDVLIPSLVIPVENCTVSSGCGYTLGGLERGQWYAFEAYAYNEAGESNVTITRQLVLEHPQPPTELAVDQELVSASLGQSTIVISWASPDDNGDGEGRADGRVYLDGYECELLVNGAGTNMSFPYSIELFRANVSWTGWQTAVVTFPGGQQFAAAQGDAIDVRIRARNWAFRSNFTATVSYRLLTLPSSEITVEAVEQYTNAINLLFDHPFDRGWGDSTAEIVGYRVEVSLCPEFNLTTNSAVCRTTDTYRPLTDIARSTVAGSPEFEWNLTRREQPLAAARYYYRVTPRNRLGESLGPSPSTSSYFMVLPSVTFPLEPSLFVATFSGATQIWAGDIMRSQMLISIYGYPAEVTTAPGSDLSVTGTVEFANFSTVYPATIAEAGSPAVIEGPSEKKFTFDTPAPPSSCVIGQCTAVATFTAVSKSVTIPLVYFEYAAPLVRSVFPSAGPATGGTLLRLGVVEYTGRRTRAGAGQPNLASAADGSSPLQVSFTCEGGSGLTFYSSQVSAAPSVGSVSAPVGQAWLDVTALLPASPCTPAASRVTANVFVSNTNLVVARPGGGPAVFNYELSWIAAVRPPAGTPTPGSGGVKISIDIGGLAAEPAGHLNVTLDGFDCTVFSKTFSAGSGIMTINALTPEMPVSRVGMLSLAVVGANDPPAVQWEYMPPPATAILRSSLTVDGVFKEWAPSAANVTLAFSVRNLAPRFGRSFDEVWVSTPPLPASKALYRQVGDHVEVTWATVMPLLPEDNLPISVVARLGESAVANISTWSDSTGATIEVRDVSLPLAVASVPGSGSQLGGTRVLVGVSTARGIVDAITGRKSMPLVPVNTTYNVSYLVVVNQSETRVNETVINGTDAIPASNGTNGTNATNGTDATNATVIRTEYVVDTSYSYYRYEIIENTTYVEAEKPANFSASATFPGGVQGHVLALVPLEEWRLKSGPRYASALAQWDLMTDAKAGQTLAGEYQDAVDSIECARPDECLVAILLSPSAPSAAAGAVQLIFNDSYTSDTSWVVEIPFEYTGNLSGAASVISASTPSGQPSGLPAGGDLVTVILSSFTVVYRTTDVSVKWQGISIPVLRLISSSPEFTQLLFVAPRGDPGVAQISISPAAQPSNVAVFSYTYINDRIPEVVDFSPERLYDAGGQTVHVSLTRFPAGTALEDVSITVDPAEVASATVSPVEIADQDADGITQLTYISPAMPAGVTTLTTIDVGGLLLKGYAQSYVKEPTTNPNIQYIEPGSGICDGDGSTIVRVVLSNFRLVEPLTNLRVTFDPAFSTSTLALATDPGMTIETTMEQTVVRFTLPFTSAKGNMGVFVYTNGRNLLKGSATFQCITPNVPEVSFVRPAFGIAGPVGSTVEVGLTYWGGLTDQTLIYMWPQSGAQSQVLSVVSSTDKLTVVRLQLISSLLITKTFSIAPCALGIQCSSRILSFPFQWIDGAAARIETFHPTSYITYGRVPLVADIANVPEGLVAADISIIFGTFILPAASFERASTGIVSVSVDLPTTAPVGPVTPVANINGTLVEFPSPFTFTDPPQAAIRSVSPSSASTANPTDIRVSLADFPGTLSIMDVGVEFEWPNTGFTSSGTVTAVKQSTVPTPDPRATQSLDIDFVSPVGNGVAQGGVTLRVYHRQFPSRSLCSVQYKFEDEGQPQILRLDVEDESSGTDNSNMHSGAASLTLPIGEPTDVSILVGNAPTDVAHIKWAVWIGTQRATISHAERGQGDARSTARLVVTSITSDVVGVVYGVVVFGEALCPSDCCKDNSCTVQCSDVRAVCLTLNYYDEARPVITVVTGQRGPALGGGLVSLVIRNFPAVTAQLPALASFGDVTHEGDVTVTSVEGDLMRITIVAPARVLTSTADETVVVNLTPMARPDFEVTFDYVYFATPVSLFSVSPSKGSALGGQEVFIEIDYMPFPSDLILRFGGVDLAMDAVKIWPQSSEKRTILSFTTPASTAGTIKASVRPDGCELVVGPGGIPCTSAVPFEFQSANPFAPSLFDPIPSSGPFQNEGTISILVQNLPPSARVSSLTASFSGTAASSLSAPQNLGGDVWQVVVRPPAGQQAAQNTIASLSYVDTADSQTYTLTFNYTFYDGTAPRLTAVSPSGLLPTSAVANGRILPIQSTVTVIIANFPQGVALDSVACLLASNTDIEAEVLELQDTPCSGLDCAFTKILMRLPSIRAPGRKLFTLTVSSSEVVTFPLEFDAPCNPPGGGGYDRFCSDESPTMIPNYWRILQQPSVGCTIDNCIDQNHIASPVVLSVSPSEGLTSGNNLVTLEIQDMPAFDAADLTVSVFGGASRIMTGVLRITQQPGSSLTSALGTVQFYTPAVPTDTDLVSFTISTSVSGIFKADKFDFEYLPIISGPPIVSLSEPSTILDTDELELYLELTNVPVVDPYPASSIGQVSATVNSAKADVEIVFSNREGAAIIVSANGPWPTGENIETRVCFLSIGCTSPEGFAVVLVGVLPTPAPSVVSVFPSLVPSANSGHHLVVIVDNFPVSLAPSDVYINLTAAGGGIANTSRLAIFNSTETLSPLMSLLSLKDLSPLDCDERSCSTVALTISLPANPDGPFGQGIASVFIGAPGDLSVVASFSYAASGTPTLDSMSHISGQVDSPPLVYLKLLEFPPGGCGGNATAGIPPSCATASLEASPPLAVSMDGTLISGVAAVDHGSDLFVTFTPPLSPGPPGIVPGSVSAGGASVAFSFIYTAPPPTFAPSEAPISGGTLVTVTAVGWGADAASAALAGQMYAEVCDLAAEVVEITTATSTATSSEITAVIRVPACPKIGRAEVYISLPGDLEAEFTLLIYQLPSVVSVVPSTSNLAGGSSVVVSISGAPAFSSAQEVALGTRVLFGTTKLALSSVIQSTGGGLSVVVSAPPASSASSLTVSVEFSGTGFKARQAVWASKFRYVAPAPAVSSVHWCASCATNRACIVGGLCGGGVYPLSGRAPTGGGGVITVTLANFPNITYNASTGLLPASPSSGASFAIDFGGSSSFSRVVYSDAQALSFEYLPSRLGTSGGTRTLTARSTSASVPTILTFPFSFYDPSVTLACTSGCVAAGSGTAGAATLVATNLYATKANQLAVSFGSIPAKTFSVSSVTSGGASITITALAPAFSCTLCAYQADGSATVKVTVTALSTGKTADVDFSFWDAPKLKSAIFGPGGGTLVLFMSNPTNKGGGSNTGCDGSLSVPSLVLLGSSPVCTWNSAGSSITVELGVGATVVVGSQLSLKEGVIKSANGVSAPADGSSVAVAPPSNASPVLLSLSGKTLVDACSDLVLEASGVSARPLTFRWTSSDAALASKIRRTSGQTLLLSTPTPDLVLGADYTITVSAVDFLGVAATPASITVRKISGSPPTVAFFPPRPVVFQDTATAISAIVSFSGCPGGSGDVVFAWRQTSGPTITPASILTGVNGSQILLPAGALLAGSTYGLAARVSVGGSTSESALSITVGRRPLVAAISGGSRIEVWNGAVLTLDASGSQDPDGGAVSRKWTCTLASLPCRDLQGSLLQLPTDNITAIVPAWTLPPTLPSGELYVFTVTAAQPGKVSATDSVSVKAFGKAIPSTSISGAGSRTINANDHLNAGGSCSSGTPSWAVDPAPLPAVSYPLGLATFSLVIAPGSLFPGTSYTIKLTCTEAASGLSGAAVLDVRVNLPPRGPPCSACLVQATGSSTRACVKTGTAITSKFKWACAGWSDADVPLSYRFGFSSTGGTGDVLWLSPSSREYLVAGFPSGRVSLYAVVIDSLGASSPTQSESIVILSAAGASTAARRAVTVDLNAYWDSVLAELSSALQRQSVNEVSTLASAASAEATIQESSGILPANKGTLVAGAAIRSLSQAAKGAVLSTAFVCEYLAASAVAVSRPKSLGNTSSPQAASLVNFLLDSSSTLESDCSLSVARVLENVLSGVAQLPSEQDAAMSQVLTSSESALHTQLRLTAKMMSGGQGVSSQSLVGNSSAHIVKLVSLSSTDPTRVSVNIPILGQASASIAGGSIGPSILGEGSASASAVGVQLVGITASPPIKGIVPVTPLVSLTLSDSQGSTLNVSSLPAGKEVLITIPITIAEAPPRPGKWWYGSYVCLYWSAAASAFVSDSSCSASAGTLQGTVDVKTNHLSMFTIEPLYENYTAPTPAPATTPAPVFTAAAVVSEGVLAEGGTGAYAGFVVVVISASAQGAWGDVHVTYTKDGSEPDCSKASSASETILLSGGTHTVRATACHMGQGTGGSVQKVIVVTEGPELLVVVGMPPDATIADYGSASVGSTIATSAGVSSQRVAAVELGRRRAIPAGSVPTKVKDRVRASRGTMGAYGVSCSTDEDCNARLESVNATLETTPLPDGRTMTLEYALAVGLTPTPAPETTPVPPVPVDTLTIAVIATALGLAFLASVIFFVWWQRRARRARVAAEKAKRAADDAAWAARKGLPPLQTDDFNPDAPPSAEEIAAAARLVPSPPPGPPIGITRPTMNIKASELLDVLGPRTESSRERAKREIRAAIMADDPTYASPPTRHPSPTKGISRPSTAGSSSGAGARVIGIGQVDNAEWIQGATAVEQLLLDRGWAPVASPTKRPNSAGRRPTTAGAVGRGPARPRWWVEDRPNDTRYEELEAFPIGDVTSNRPRTAGANRNPEEEAKGISFPIPPPRGASKQKSGVKYSDLNPLPKMPTPPSESRPEGGSPNRPKPSWIVGDQAGDELIARPRASGNGRFLRDETSVNAMKRLKNVYRNLRTVEEGLASSRPSTAAPPPPAPPRTGNNPPATE